MAIVMTIAELNACITAAPLLLYSHPLHGLFSKPVLVETVIIGRELD